MQLLQLLIRSTDVPMYISALQRESKCFCGNNYGKHGSLSDSECNGECALNATQNCGGIYANAVYGGKCSMQNRWPQLRSLAKKLNGAPSYELYDRRQSN